MTINLKYNSSIIILLSLLIVACNSNDQKSKEYSEPKEKPVIEHTVEKSIDTIVPVLLLRGSVGSFTVEMEIISSDWETGSFEGRYRYQDKADYLEIKGKILGNCYHIEEFYENKQTGSFILQKSGNDYTGVWFSDNKSYETELAVFGGDTSAVKKQTLQELSQNVSSSILGTYSSEHYFINDFYVTEEEPAYEVGFSGGDIVISNAEGENIYFRCEMVIGPTCHLAIAEGIAKKQGDIYIYSEDLGADSPCRITLIFTDKAVYVQASDNSSCGFGARAYLDHHFIKIMDTAE